MSESRISLITAADVWPWSSAGGNVVQGISGRIVWRTSARTEGCLDHANLGGGCVEPGECAPVVDDQAGADHFGSAVDRAGLHPVRRAK